MINFKFGFNFEFKRDKSEDKLVLEHEQQLQDLKRKETEWQTKRLSILENGLQGSLTQKLGVKA